MTKSKRPLTEEEKKQRRDREKSKALDAVIPDDPRVNLDEYQTAKLMNCSVYKIRRDRWAGGGIPYVKLSDSEQGAVRYRRQDIDSFLAGRVRKSTSYHGTEAA